MRWIWLFLAGCGVSAPEWEGSACVDDQGALRVTIDACTTSCKQGISIRCKQYQYEDEVTATVFAEVPIGTSTCERTCEVITATCEGAAVDMGLEPKVDLWGSGSVDAGSRFDTAGGWGEPLSRCATL